MYRLIFLNFIRSRSVMISLMLFFMTGLTSIYIGKQFLEKQQGAAASVTRLQKEQIDRNLSYMPDQFGLLMYYLRFAFVNKPEPIAALAIGQQDVNTSIQYLTIRGLEGQRYDTDLYNPYHQLTGNFDLSFVILFLFPLLVIAFNFNLLAQEKESGTWSLINVQAVRPLSLILQRLSIRLITVTALLVMLIAIAAVLIGIPVDDKLIAFTVASFIYLMVWFAISFFIISLHKGSSVSALLLLSAWVMLCLLIPAIVNNYITSRYPVQEAYRTFIKQRDGYHNKWDKNPDSTMQVFFRHYPQFRHYVWNSPKFNYMWYYAMQQLGDDESAPDRRAMQQKLEKRQATAANAALFFPSMHTQLQFTEIAGTGLQQNLQYQDSTAAFHERYKLHFYPKIFGDSVVAAENWKVHVPQYFKSTNLIQWGLLVWPAVLFIVLFCTAGALIFRRTGVR